MKAIAKRLKIEGGIAIAFFDANGNSKVVERSRLFAVTQDVKVGDDVVFNDETEHLDNKDTITRIDKGKHEYHPDTYHFKNHKPLWANPYKVLGLISPNATWVKDGDPIKVKENGIQLDCSKCHTYAVGNGSVCISHRNGHKCGGVLTWISKPLLVKCSQCNTYH